MSLPPRLLALTHLAHACLILYLHVFVYITRSPAVLSSIIILCAGILLQWFLFNQCILTVLENTSETRPSTYESGMQMSSAGAYLVRLTGNERTVYHVLSVLPFVSLTVATVRLYALASSTQA